MNVKSVSKKEIDERSFHFAAIIYFVLSILLCIQAILLSKCGIEMKQFDMTVIDSLYITF